MSTCLWFMVQIIAPSPAWAQDDNPGGDADAPSATEAEVGRFAPFDWLVGEWRGYGEFSNRTTYIHKRYEYDIGGVYFVERTLDMFPPPELSTEFEIHQDVSYFYKIGATGEYRVKTFFVEGFVTTAAVSASDDGSEIVIEATEVENGPPGMRSRITYTREGPDRFRGLFELAMPGREYGKVEELTMTRIQ